MSEKKESGLRKRIRDKAINFINDVDHEACLHRVAAMKTAFPDASSDDLADRLIKNKARKAAALGAATALPGIVPGFGTFAALTIGSGLDITVTYRYQAELVLELAEVYGHTLTEEHRQKAIMLITGVSVGASKVLSGVGKELAKKAGEQVARRSISKVLPLVGVGASAGMNLATTYAIGMRARAYYQLGEQQMQDWSECARAISGVDERKLVSWLKRPKRLSLQP